MFERIKNLPARFFPNGGMIAKLWDRLTKPSSSLIDVNERRVARLASSFLFVITVLNLVGGLARLHRLKIHEAFGGSLGFSLAFAAIAYILSRTRWHRSAIFVFSLGFSFSAYFAIAEQGNEANFSSLILVYVPLSLIVASSFLSPWAVFLLSVLNIAALFLLEVFGFATLPENIGALSGIIATIGFVLILLSSYRNGLEKARLEELREINRDLEQAKQNLEAHVTERTRAAESARMEAEAARAAAESARASLETQVWLARGQAQLAEAMRGGLNISRLAENVASQLCQYLDAHAGALYLLQNNELTLVGRYALTERSGFNGKIQMGEGLVGQAAADGKILHLENIPPNTYVISTGLANLTPRQLIAAPFQTNGELVGILEFSALIPFGQDHFELLNRTSESIGVAFRTAQTRQRLADLLEESQQQTEELQAQEEELRAANEELHAQTETLRVTRELSG